MCACLFMCVFVFACVCVCVGIAYVDRAIELKFVEVCVILDIIS